MADTDRLVRAGRWLLAGSLLLWPLAIAAFVVGVKLLGRERTTAGAWIAALAALAATVGFMVSLAALSGP